jgi:hypothetical protein
MESAWDTIQTSIGPLRIKACARNYFNVATPSGTYPFVMFSIELVDGSWTPGTCIYYPDHGEEAPVPDALLKELTALGTRWADAHLEAFEAAGTDEFKDMAEYIVDDAFADVVEKLKEAQEDLRDILKEPEFVLQASKALRRRVQKEAQRLGVMRLQISGAGKAIRTLAGTRTAGPENQSSV